MTGKNTITNVADDLCDTTQDADTKGLRRHSGGRKSIYAEPMRGVNLSMTDEHRDKLNALGGSPFVRLIIDLAPLPTDPRIKKSKNRAECVQALIEHYLQMIDELDQAKPSATKPPPATKINLKR